MAARIGKDEPQLDTDLEAEEDITLLTCKIDKNLMKNIGDLCDSKGLEMDAHLAYILEGMNMRLNE